MQTDVEPEGIPTKMPLAAIKILNVEDYDKATARVAELAGYVEDSSQEPELVAPVDAIMQWDKAHDNATA